MALNVAVIGLGSMGYGIATSVLRAGHATWGVDVYETPMTLFREDGGQPGNVADAAGSLDAVVVAVLNAAQTETVLFGEAGLVPGLKPGAVVISCATVPPDFARALIHQSPVV